MPKSPKVRAGILVALLIIAIAGGVSLMASREPRKGKFCTPSLPIQEVNGKTVAVQTHGSHGGVCAVPGTNPGMDTLGFDCRVRGPDGKVLTTVKPSHADGTC